MITTSDRSTATALALAKQLGYAWSTDLVRIAQQAPRQQPGYLALAWDRGVAWRVTWRYPVPGGVDPEPLAQLDWLGPGDREWHTDESWPAERCRPIPERIVAWAARHGVTPLLPSEVSYLLKVQRPSSRTKTGSDVLVRS